MKKIIIIIIFSILLNSCGFKKINRDADSSVYIRTINVSGDNRIGYILKNNILLISKKGSNKKYDIDIKLKNTRTSKIKDISGKTSRFNESIALNLVLENIDNSEKIIKSFTESRDYDVGKNHTTTIRNQKNAIKNIIEQLSDEIINFLTLSIKY